MEPSQIDMMEEKELRMELNKAVVEIIAIKQEEWKTRKSFLITEDSLNTANEIIDENINEISTLKEKIEELKNPWVSVETEFPDSGRCVLLYSKQSGVGEGAYISAKEHFEQWRWNAILKTVTYWCELPAPPISQKPGGDNERR